MAPVSTFSGATVSGDSAALALAAYEPLAPFYDSFTSDYAYDEWLGQVEEWARAHGLSGRRLLDVACGTGKSFEPMIERGYVVSACDLSPAMVERARERGGHEADVRVADMRFLPWRDEFDLVTCMDDGLNYLLSAPDLEAALGSMAGALRPGGILICDVNSLLTYRTTFAEEFEVSHGPVRFHWRGRETRRFAASGTARATIEVRAGRRTCQSHHVERHWPLERLRAACESAGFDRVRFRGQVSGGRLVGDPDESEHIKVVCLAAKAGRRRG
jgi:SAM-dependent methyltransferase